MNNQSPQPYILYVVLNYLDHWNPWCNHCCSFFLFTKIDC